MTDPRSQAYAAHLAADPEFIRWVRLIDLAALTTERGMTAEEFRAKYMGEENGSHHDPNA